MSGAKEIIAIDGPSGSGKSTISRMLADRLNYTYLDTGAMYRAVGLKVKQSNVDLKESARLQKLLAELNLTLLPGDQQIKVLLDGEDISMAIRSEEAGMMASKVSAVGAVREKLTAIQKEMGARGGVVAEGRDMGTVVFPGARYKFFLSASPEERARRRTLQLQEKGQQADYDEIMQQITQRDKNDSSRTLSPLKPAADAVIVDSSQMNIDEVIQFMQLKMEEKNGRPGR